MNSPHIDGAVRQTEGGVLDSLPSDLYDLVQRAATRDLVDDRQQVPLDCGLYFRSR
jgi:hypothetical protein